MVRKYTPVTAAEDVEATLGLLEGRWKLVLKWANLRQKM